MLAWFRSQQADSADVGLGWRREIELQQKRSPQIGEDKLGAEDISERSCGFGENAASLEEGKKRERQGGEVTGVREV